ncbi:MAG: ankyrin repeat domain-containing protein [Pseudomonadota bacterium]
MPNTSELIQALNAGDVELLSALSPSDVDQDVLADDDVHVALRHAAERVVFHRSNYHKSVKHVVGLGARCDIWTAARAGLVEHVKRLLSETPELLNATDGSGRTSLQRSALVYGVCHECEEVVDFLILEGACVDAFTASTFCLPDIVGQALGQRPALISDRFQGSTLLNWAVRPRRNVSQAANICRALLDAGADVNDRDREESGMTPLHHAAEWGSPVCLELVDLLLRAGGDINCLDEQGWTPLDYARDRERSDMVSHLTMRGAIGKI